MPSRVLHVLAPSDPAASPAAGRASLLDGIAVVQHELGVEAEFPAVVEATARQAARTPRLPTLDRTDIPFVTIDPPASMDLDQALHIERDGSGFVVHYAIADVAAFVAPGDPVDEEAHRRGETLYGAGAAIPLHPRALSEGAASLLPDTIRPALLWTIRVDEHGEGTDVHVERALVRSHARLDYAGLQKSVDDGTADPMIGLLGEVGVLRKQREIARGGISLPLPEQVVDVGTDPWTLGYRTTLPVEEWNAQISLLTGMAAASLMIAAKVGLLRTLPPAPASAVERLHHTAEALEIPWPTEQPYPDFIRSLDPSLPAHAAMVVACTRLLRGSGYAAFHGEVPAQPLHAGLAAAYAHVTAPLRRLADRYAGEVCVALCAGVEPPAWVLERLDDLPRTMERSDHLAHQYERAVLDLVESTVLSSRVGETFSGVVVQVDDGRPSHGDIVVPDPAVDAPVRSETPLPLGAGVRARLVAADPATWTVRFEI